MNDLIDIPNRVFKRFCERVDQSDTYGCWPWTGATIKGYGQIYWKDNLFRYGRRTHRIAWEIAHGPIPEGMTVHHKCYNTLCCNPAHLSLMTPGENSSDKGWRKTHCKKGHPLTEANSYYYGNTRSCAECSRIRSREYQRRKRAGERNEI